jgi:hypothetical protein
MERKEKDKMAFKKMRRGRGERTRRINERYEDTQEIKLRSLKNLMLVSLCLLGNTNKLIYSYYISLYVCFIKLKNIW